MEGKFELYEWWLNGKEFATVLVEDPRDDDDELAGDVRAILGETWSSIRFEPVKLEGPVEFDVAVLKAAELGREAGRLAGESATPTNKGAAVALLGGLESGAIELTDEIDPPDLSGEFAGERTPASLVAEVSLDAEAIDPELEDELCRAYEGGVSETFEETLLETIRNGFPTIVCECGHGEGVHALHHPGLSRPCRFEGCGCSSLTFARFEEPVR